MDETATETTPRTRRNQPETPGTTSTEGDTKVVKRPNTISVTFPPELLAEFEAARGEQGLASYIRGLVSQAIGKPIVMPERATALKGLTDDEKKVRQSKAAKTKRDLLNSLYKDLLAKDPALVAQIEAQVKAKVEAELAASGAPASE